MSRLCSHLFVVCLSGTGLGLLACGADTGDATVDASADGAGDVGISLQDAARLDAPTADTSVSTDGPPGDAQPTVSVDPSVAFAEIAGTYGGKAAMVSGTASALFDNGLPYTFSITADGAFSATTKGAAESFTWTMHAKRITRNTKNKVTVVEFEDPGKRLLNLTYVPGAGPFDVAGVMLEPQGRWYLTAISKM